MKTINVSIIFSCLLISNNLISQDYCIPGRFTDEYYFQSKDIQVDRDIIYGHVSDHKGKTLSLDLDVFYPKFSVDSLTKRPLIMLIHGGGGNKTSMYTYCPLFAERGFVVATITCRTQINTNEVTGLKGAYQSLQDAHAALRFIICNATKFGIDTNAVFVGGQSAGALSSTALTYINQQDFDNRYPKITNLLGRIDNATNEVKTKFTIRGVIDMWGQIPDTSFISCEEAHNIPIIMFHGTADSSLSRYEKSVQISKRFKNLGGCYQLHTKTGAGHGQNMKKYYIAAKASCFIKSIFCNSCYSLEREIDNEDLNCDLPLSIDLIPWKRTFKSVNITINREFIGEYRFIDEDGKKRVLLIYSEDQHLFLGEKKDKEKIELFPENENDFYFKDFNAQLSFNKDIHGKVNGLTFYIDAKEIFAKKIK